MEFAFKYKTAVLTFKVLHDSVPRYLGPVVADLLVGELCGQQVPAT